MFTKIFTKERIVGLALLVMLMLPLSAAQAEGMSDQKLDFYISAAAKYHAIDPDLLRAVIWQESRRNHAAVSPKGATGYTQLMPGTAKGLGVNPRDPWHNIFGGAKYLREMLDRYNNRVDLALAAYNAGPKRVKEVVPNIAETRYYVAAVLFYYQWYQKNS
ncbi:MAG: hypothetical protein ACD_74C00069G0020 [uncultured bacterium]|nr:MAG: hypothetical protein ACD_74C00069G0020 [uncultured bacterium]